MIKSASPHQKMILGTVIAGMALLAALWLLALSRGLAGQREQLLQALHAEVADALQQPVQHLDGGAGVGERPVGRAWSRCRTAAPAPRAGRWGPRRGSARRGRAGPCTAPAGAARRCPWRSQAARRNPESNGALCATSTAPRRNSSTDGQHRPAAAAPGHHRGGDAGERDDVGRQPGARVDQRGQLADPLAAAHLDRADLGDRVGAGGAAGGLQVEHDEGDLAQRGAELVEGELGSASDGCSGHGRGR